MRLFFALLLVVPLAAAGPVEDTYAETYDCRTMPAVYPPRNQCVMWGHGVGCLTHMGPFYGATCHTIGILCMNHATRTSSIQVSLDSATCSASIQIQPT